MVNIQGGLLVLEKYGDFQTRFTEKVVYTDILREELSLVDQNKLSEFEWTGIDDYVGYELNYSEEFEEYFSRRSMWGEFMSYAFGGPNHQVKALAWDAWNQSQKSRANIAPLPAYKLYSNQWCE